MQLDYDPSSEHPLMIRKRGALRLWNLRFVGLALQMYRAGASIALTVRSVDLFAQLISTQPTC